MNPSPLPANINLGFLTVYLEAAGYVGGYLVTNSWGRPLEFRLSSAVQPNRTQQILYGPTLMEYICTELIGKALIEKTSTTIQLLITDTIDVLPIRSRLSIPVVALCPTTQSTSFDRIVLDHARSSQPLAFSSRFAADDSMIQKLLERIDAGVDLTEPFNRIRDAMSEARKMGVLQRGQNAA